ncbi:hypothetical protein JG687_00003958 [Phytophthora cactorum]|uniref:RxLR effector protein n=2 Tax=Phytophthora TaxID=4783 RepID=A0A8J5J1D5_9STRA|nr:hypothetical protein JG687_00003958 [Phytophthora cactorum]KAG6972509.1 hypothetical protein JG688_00003956 [Phytophthora aleatoria]
MNLHPLIAWTLVSWTLLFRPGASAPPNFTTFASSRPTDPNVELASFLPSVVYDNLDGDKTATLVTPSAGVLVAHDSRYYTENVLESRLNYPSTLLIMKIIYLLPNSIIMILCQLQPTKLDKGQAFSKTSMLLLHPWRVTGFVSVNSLPSGL